LATLVDGEWFDIGSFETYLDAHQKLQEESLLIQGKSREKNNKFSGKVFIGENCLIEDCKLHNVIIYPNTILRNCHISHSVIDKNCHLEGLDLNQKLIRSRMKQIF
jgi:glucose-1-phosphate thymidylyltransferase